MKHLIINKELELLLRPLDEKEYDSLKSNIKEQGVLDPIKIWQYNNQDVIIDGHHRYKIANELGIKYKTEELRFDNLIDAKIWMCKYQNHRRNLSIEDKLKLASEIHLLLEKKRPGPKKNSSTTNNGGTPKVKSDEPIVEASKLAGIGISTYQKYHKVMNSNLVDDSVKQKITEPDNNVTSYGVYKQLVNQENKIKLREEYIEAGKNIEISSDLIDIRHGDLNVVLNDIPDGSIDCIVTDPPYPEEYIQTWSDLSKLAARVLKPNGFCFAYSGTLHLPEVMNRMSEHLTYYWNCILLHTVNHQLTKPGAQQKIMPRNLITGYKSVLMYQNGFSKMGNINGAPTFYDIITTEGREKSHHEWQQGLNDMTTIIDYFTKPGDTILDPFCGSGTTAIISAKMKRKCITCEIIDDDYHKAKKRIQDELIEDLFE